MSKKIEFLISLGNLIKTGAVKNIKQAMDFAKQQFGKVDQSFVDDIVNVFKKEGKTKKGDVVPIKKQEGIVKRPEEFDTRKEYEKYLDEVLGPPDDVFGSPLKDDLLKEWDKVKAKNVTPNEGIMATDEATEIVKKRTDDIATGDPTGETSDPITKFKETQKTLKKLLDELNEMGKPIKNPHRPGGPLDPKIGIVRTAVREILHNNLKAGKINIPDAAEKEAIERYMANKDPIDIFRKTYGEDALEAIDSVADNLLEIDQAGGSYAGINKFLQDNKLFDFVPKKTYGYDESIVSADKILKQAEQDAKNKKILEDFDPKDRTENADGGIIGNLRLNRTGFDDGSEDPKISRRKFMKIMGGLAALPIVGKFFKLAKPAAGLVKSVGSGTTPPSYFFNLINKIKIMGDDVTPKYATQERQRVTKYKDFELTEDIVTGEKTIKRNISADPDVDGPPNMVEETYMNYKPGKGQMDETTKGKTPPDEYTEDTTFIRNDRENTGEIYSSVDGVGDDVIQEGIMFKDKIKTDFSKENFKKSMKKFKKIDETIEEGDGYTKIEKITGKIQNKASGGIIGNLRLNRTGYGLGSVPKLYKAGQGTFTKAQVLIQRLENTIKEYKGKTDELATYVLETFPNFIKELKANPKLANNENVWKQLGQDLPSDQELVVYGDDTVDFFRQTEGPGNIERVTKFLEKNPFLNREEAIKIMKMEPTDQVMEVERLKTIRTKKYALGGRVQMADGGLINILKL